MNSSKNSPFIVAKEPHPVGLYVHIPFCRQKCSYCDFAAYERIETYQEKYVESLLEEFHSRLEIYQTMYPSFFIDTLYLGGGTPTHLQQDLLKKILCTIHATYPLEKMREVTVEANPGDGSIAFYRELLKLGVTRLSFGVQVMDDEVLALLRRSHTVEDVYRTLEYMEVLQFPHVNVDFMYALPKMSDNLLEKSLHLLQHPSIDHVSMYGLQLEYSTQLYSQVKKQILELPNEDEVERQYDKMVSKIPEYGFERYEISNFAKAGGEAIHNKKYWHYEDYIGIGAGAHGFYSLGANAWYRYENTPYVVPYIQKEGHCVVQEEQIDKKRSMEDFCFLALRTSNGIDVTRFEDLFQISFGSVYGETIDSLLKEGLLMKHENRFSLTPFGMKLGNYVFEKFLK